MLKSVVDTVGFIVDFQTASNRCFRPADWIGRRYRQARPKHG
jgi:hypothetical protein